jgi:hypothetical protein
MALDIPIPEELRDMFPPLGETTGQANPLVACGDGRNIPPQHVQLEIIVSS